MRRARILPFLLLLAIPASCSRRAARIDVSPKKLKIYGLEHTQRLSAKLLDKRDRQLEIGTANWESAKPDVAAVDSGGLVTPKAEGKTRIIARYDGVTAEVPVEIVDVKNVEVQPASFHLVGPPGTRLPLQAVVKNSKDQTIGLPVTWSSAKPEVATVGPDGVVASAGRGTTMLIAKVGDIQGAAEVQVEIHEIGRLELRPATALVRVGDSQQFSVIAYRADGTAIEGAAAIFSSTNPAVARVNPAGRADGIAPGAATIRVTLGTIAGEATLIVN
ncbi:MAG: Ig-like domain-containing protein [Acidobacteriota bacterium]